MQPVPPVNIIMSFDYKVMQKFQEYKSLDLFRKDHKEAKYFDNAPMSIFVSLTHQLGLKGGKKGALMEVEFLDPEGTFEQEVLNISTQANLDPNESLLRKAVKDKEGKINEIIKKRDALVELNKNISNPKLQRDIAALTEQIERGEAEKESLDYSLTESATKGETRLRNFANAQMQSKIQKPVYIAYGVGDNLMDWCSPQCFGKLMGVEYNFNTNGARSIKLLYSAMSVHPNLTELGLSPLGELGYGTVTVGSSFDIFNKEKFKIRYDQISKELDEKLNKETSLSMKSRGEEIIEAQQANPNVSAEDIELWVDTDLDEKKGLGTWDNISYHQAISDCIRKFIRQGVKWDNVIVLLPNLDRDLSGFLRERRGELRGSGASKRSFKSSSLKFGICKEALEDLGLDLVEWREGIGSAVIGNNQYNILEACSSREQKEKFFQDTRFSVVAQVDNITKTFQEKLEQVAESLSNAIAENPSKIMQGFRVNRDIDEDSKYFAATLPLMSPPVIHVETDFNIIQLMLKHGLIEDGSQPVVIWGSKEMIDLFIFGELSSKAEAMLIDDNGLVDRKKLKSKILAFGERNLHPFDETTFGANISKAYLDDVYDYVYPSPWIGPFGPTGQVGENEYFLTDDMNLKNTSLVSIKGKKVPSILERQPIFAFGTKNTNILEVAIDINNQYMTLINNTNPSVLTGAALADAIVPEGYESEYNEFFSKFSGINLKDLHEDYGIPNDFIDMVSQWVHKDEDSGSIDINGMGKWQDVINALKGGGSAEEINDHSFVIEATGGANSGFQHVVEGGETARRKAAYTFLWETFTALFAVSSKVNRPSPKSTKTYPGKNGTKAAISNYARTVDRMSKMALKGNITTIPMFSLCNQMRVINRPCKLYCIEPQFFNSDNSNLKSKKHFTWFSGSYQMLGFKHTITNSSAKSEFLIGRSGGQADTVKAFDSGEPENPEEASDGS